MLDERLLDETFDLIETPPNILRVAQRRTHEIEVFGRVHLVRRNVGEHGELFCVLLLPCDDEGESVFRPACRRVDDTFDEVRDELRRRLVALHDVGRPPHAKREDEGGVGFVLPSGEDDKVVDRVLGGLLEPHAHDLTAIAKFSGAVAGQETRQIRDRDLAFEGDPATARGVRARARRWLVRRRAALRVVGVGRLLVLGACHRSLSPRRRHHRRASRDRIGTLRSRHGHPRVAGGRSRARAMSLSRRCP
ncbi:MAG: hypothetical protein V9G12_15875 [Microthrixaceae bacterium]